MSEMITVSISDMKIAKSNETLVTYALGSCIGICLYDPLNKIGALGHIMLPNAVKKDNDDNKFKYADTCIVCMLKAFSDAGCAKNRLIAKIAGGAQMFKTVCSPSAQSIGDRNIIAVKKALSDAGISLYAEDTGKNYGRTVYFDTSDGKVTIKSFVNGISVL